MKFILTAVVVFASMALAQGSANCPSKIARTNCTAPRDVGTRQGNNCSARAGRAWWYDDSSRDCKAMNYLGCGGNGNRYCTKEICERACLKRPNCPAEVARPNCTAERDEGTSRGRDCPTRAGRVWWYDARSRECKSMDYRGCGGNANRYCTNQLCERACRRRP